MDAPKPAQPAPPTTRKHALHAAAGLLDDVQDMSEVYPVTEAIMSVVDQDEQLACAIAASMETYENEEAVHQFEAMQF